MRGEMGPRDRSIRNIPLPSHGRRSGPEPHEVYADDTRVMRRRPKKSRFFLWLALAVVAICVVGGLLLSTLFVGASVVVYPRTASVTPPASLTAVLNAPQGSLAYQVMSISQSATTSVPATGSKQVSLVASGSVTIYNAYSTASQRLIANTRFEAPDGKIYRIHDSVTVPGATKKVDNTLTPGSIAATLYADSSGAEYNRGSTKFTIPGFKGDPRYDAFYAQGDKIDGGFVGTRPSVAQGDLSKAKESLEQSLENSAGTALTAAIPEGFMAIPGTFQVSYSAPQQAPGENGTANISEVITATGSIVKKSDLAGALAKATVSGYGGEAVDFADISQISISTATTSKNTAPIQIAITGAPTLVWQYDAEALKGALVGKPKSEFENLINSFKPAIASAEAKVRPFWESSFPSDPHKIEVKTGKK